MQGIIMFPVLSINPYFLLDSTLANPSQKISAASYMQGIIRLSILSIKPYFPFNFILVNPP
jgi:hypothetical protein